MRVSVLVRLIVYMVIGGACWALAAMSEAADNTELETTVRALVRANAEKDLPAMSMLMAHDADITSYTIGGRKYVGWPDLERDIKEEFGESRCARPSHFRTEGVVKGRYWVVHDGHAHRDRKSVV